MTLIYPFKKNITSKKNTLPVEMEPVCGGSIDHSVCWTGHVVYGDELLAYGPEACPGLLASGGDLVGRQEEAMLTAVPQLNQVGELDACDGLGPIC